MTTPHILCCLLSRLPPCYSSINAIRARMIVERNAVDAYLGGDVPLSCRSGFFAGWKWSRRFAPGERVLACQFLLTLQARWSPSSSGPHRRWSSTSGPHRRCGLCQVLHLYRQELLGLEVEVPIGKQFFVLFFSQSTEGAKTLCGCVLESFTYLFIGKNLVRPGDM